MQCVDSTGSLFFHLRFALYMINKLCPGSNIVFSNILPRKEWRYSTNHKAMDDIPKCLNRGIISYLLQHNGCYIHHYALYAHDGVHLSFFRTGHFYLRTTRSY